jgi:hypothetical protein
VTLKFSENYWTATGKRLFKVILNGTTVLSNFDIFADAGGQYIAGDKTYSATVNSQGQIPESTGRRVHRWGQCKEQIELFSRVPGPF